MYKTKLQIVVNKNNNFAELFTCRYEMKIRQIRIKYLNDTSTKNQIGLLSVARNIFSRFNDGIHWGPTRPYLHDQGQDSRFKRVSREMRSTVRLAADEATYSCVMLLAIKLLLPNPSWSSTFTTGNSFKLKNNCI